MSKVNHSVPIKTEAEQVMPRSEVVSSPNMNRTTNKLVKQSFKKEKRDKKTFGGVSNEELSLSRDRQIFVNASKDFKIRDLAKKLVKTKRIKQISIAKICEEEARHKRFQRQSDLDLKMSQWSLQSDDADFLKNLQDPIVRRFAILCGSMYNSQSMIWNIVLIANFLFEHKDRLPQRLFDDMMALLPENVSDMIFGTEKVAGITQAEGLEDYYDVIFKSETFQPLRALLCLGTTVLLCKSDFLGQFNIYDYIISKIILTDKEIKNVGVADLIDSVKKCYKLIVQILFDREALFNKEKLLREWMRESAVHRAQVETFINFITTLPEVPNKYTDIDKFSVEYARLLDIARSRLSLAILKDNSNYVAFNKEYLALQESSNIFYRKVKGTKNRIAPFGVFIFGESGVGKSSHINWHHYLLNGAIGVTATEDTKYVRTSRDKFWSGYTTDVNTIIMDEIGANKPTAITGVDPSIEDMLNVMNNIRFDPPQAIAEDKGEVACCPNIVICASNFWHMNAKSYYNNSYAVARRFPFFVEVKVKENFRDDDGKLDRHRVERYKEKLSPERREYLRLNPHMCDYWDFNVYIPRAQEISATEVQFVLEDIALEGTKKYGIKENASCCTFDTSKDYYNFIMKECQGYYNSQKDVVAMLRQPPQVCGKCRSLECICTISGVATTIQSDSYTQEDDYSAKFSTPYSIDNFIYHWGEVKGICEFFKLLMVYLIYSVFGVWNLWKINIISTLFCWYATFVYWWGMTRKYHTRIKKYGPFILVGLGALFAGYMYCKKRRSVNKEEENSIPVNDLGRPQGNTSSFDPTKFERTVVKDKWYEGIKLNETPGTFVSSIIKSSNAFSISQFSEIISRNVYRVQLVKKDGNIARTTALALGGQVYVINSHAIEHEYVAIRLYQQESEDMSDDFSRNMPASKFVIHTKGDLSFLRLPWSPKPDITKYILSEGVFEANQDGFYVTRERSGEMVIKNVTNASLLHKPSGPKWSEDNDIWRGYVTPSTEAGNCGSPLICKNGFGYCILGIHVAIDEETQRSCAIRLTTEILSPIMDQVFGQRPIHLGQLALSKSIHPKCILNDIEDKGHATVYGTLNGFRSSSKCSAAHTQIRQFLPIDYVDKHAKPDLGSSRAWRLNVEPMLHTTRKMDFDIINECADALYNDISKTMTQRDYDQIQVLSDEVAINGMDGVDFMPRINEKTSVGFPSSGPKLDIFKLLPASELNDKCFALDDDNYERYKEYEESIRAGILLNCVFKGTLKDEVLPALKVLQGKARLFTGANVHFSILVRKYYLPIVRWLQLNTKTSELLVGVNPFSDEWDNIRADLSKFGEDSIVAGDFSKYDKTMPPELMEAAFSILLRVCKDAGYSDEDIRAMEALSKDICYPIVDVNGTLMRFEGTNPSGHPLTVIINSIANSLYMRYVFHRLQVKNTGSSNLRLFKGVVVLKTYGDDNIMGVNKKVVPWFNHTAIAAEFKIIGINYTMADKDTESTAFIHINQAQFLKRFWVYNTDLKRYISRLDEGSITKMLMWKIPSKSVSSAEQERSIVTSAIREYFSYGREIFDKKRSMFVTIITELNLGSLDKLPTYDSLLEEFREG
jgi:hypothetical protein